MFFSGASFTLGFVGGFGTGFVTRELTHISTIALRPAVKELIKSSMQIADRSREALARAGEHFEDLLAEARTEISATQQQGTDTNLAATDDVQSVGDTTPDDQVREPRVAAGG